MADYIAYWKDYSHDTAEQGEAAVNNQWYTANKPVFDEMRPGDDLWVVISYGTDEWRLLQRIRIRRLRDESAIRPPGEGNRSYHMLGDDLQSTLFPIEEQTDFAPILAGLTFASGKRIQAKGRAIGSFMQSIRPLSEEDGALLRTYERELSGENRSFWWVNHKQTRAAEINGGYIWSPKTHRDGKKNETYLNLPRTRPGDLVFSYAGAEIGAVGVVTGPCIQRERPAEFGGAGEAWSRDGWMVPIEWQHLEHPIASRDHISEISPLLPERNSPLRPDGRGNQICYLAAISRDLGDLLLSLIGADESSFLDPIMGEQSAMEADAAENSIRVARSLDETEKAQLIKARRGQGVFRLNVEKMEGCCRVTGLSDKSFLIASHIKPWKDFTNVERLDGNNGLLLSPLVDKLFDRGWISFTDAGGILCANEKARAVMAAWNLQTDVNVGKFSPEQREYLEYHRSHVYRKRRG